VTSPPLHVLAEQLAVVGRGPCSRHCALVVDDGARIADDALVRRAACRRRRGAAADLVRRCVPPRRSVVAVECGELAGLRSSSAGLRCAQLDHHRDLVFLAGIGGAASGAWQFGTSSADGFVVLTSRQPAGRVCSTRAGRVPRAAGGDAIGVVGSGCLR